MEPCKISIYALILFDINSMSSNNEYNSNRISNNNQVDNQDINTNSNNYVDGPDVQEGLGPLTCLDNFKYLIPFY